MTSSLVLTALGALTLIAVPEARSQQSVGMFEGQTDVGVVKIAGSATYDDDAQQYTVEGSGENMWFDHDAFHLVWRKMTGNFIVRARAHFDGDGRNAHRKLGWIVRSSLDSSSAYVDAAIHGDGLTSLQYRRTTAAETEEMKSWLSAPDVIQLERDGSTYTMSVAHSGEPFVRTQLEGIDLGSDVYVGIYVCSHDPDTSETAQFDNVRIVIPPPAGYTPYRDYIGSNLEILDVETGDRRIIHQDPGSIQAPNWTPDGKALIFNKEGRLYRFDLKTEDPVEINTGFATSNNNDHVLSFDGKMLGISNHVAENDNHSIVFTVPVEGGTPSRVTQEGPSYLHGWSPDGMYLTYTAQRNGDFDIYKIPTGGGTEERLTTAEGLDDGPEYSPDGETIYFNSVRSGSMQLWRMKPDGSEQEQLTDDGYNNWFPHISPDGQRMIFLSFSREVDPSDHPFYKHVYLRTMPVDGGTPRIVAYVYGGQGTINVPSWSPDGTHVAFVSNTDFIR